MGKRRPPDTIEIDPTMLTNVPIGKKTPPDGKPWEAFLWTYEIRGKNRLKRVEAFEAPTQDDLSEAIRAFVERPNVVLRETDYVESTRPRAASGSKGKHAGL